MQKACTSLVSQNGIVYTVADLAAIASVAHCRPLQSPSPLLPSLPTRRYSERRPLPPTASPITDVAFAADASNFITNPVGG